MKGKNLLILGGGELNQKCVSEAKAHGFTTYVADKNPKAPCFAIADHPVIANISDPLEMLKATAGLPIEGVVSMAEAGVISCATLTEKLGTGGIDLSTALKCTSKAAMRKAWAGSGYSVRYNVVTTYEEALKAARELNTYPLIIKPDKTFGGSRGVSKINSETELKDAIDYAIASRMNEWIVIEECAEGPEFSCEVVVYNGTSHLLCIGQKVKSPLPYRVDCSVQYPAELNTEQEKEVERMCASATERIGLKNGVAHIEFAYTHKGPVLFELGARCGGGHTPMIAKHVSGINEFIAYCSIACSLQPELKPSKTKKAADYRFIIFEPGTISNIVIPESVSLNPAVYDLVLSVKKGDTVAGLANTSARAGAAVVFGNTLNEVIQLSRDICSKIMVEYTDGRKKSAIVL